MKVSIGSDHGGYAIAGINSSHRRFFPENAIFWRQVSIADRKNFQLLEKTLSLAING
jgi:hypothetical protein